MECTWFYYPGIEKSLQLVSHKTLECQVQIDQEGDEEDENSTNLITGLIDASKENSLFLKVLGAIHEQEDKKLNEDCDSE